MKRVMLAAALASLAAAAQAQTAQAQTQSQASAPLRAYGEPIRLEAAQAIMTAALDAARAADLRMAIAIVEPTGEPVAFSRIDDTQYASVSLALAKARSAGRFRSPTASLEERVTAGRTVMLAVEDAMPIGGGVPIVVDGRVIGAIGISGGTAAQDHEIAVAAIAAMR